MDRRQASICHVTIREVEMLQLIERAQVRKACTGDVAASREVEHAKLEHFVNRVVPKRLTAGYTKRQASGNASVRSFGWHL